MILGMIMTFILYMFLLLYGQMVMTSIIEEKNNRVLELMVSSVRPIDLMLGKIIARWACGIAPDSCLGVDNLLGERLCHAVDTARVRSE